MRACVQNKKAEDLANRGGGLAQQGIEIFVQRDEWDKVRLRAGSLCVVVQGLRASSCRVFVRRHAEGSAPTEPFATHGP